MSKSAMVSFRVTAAQKALLRSVCHQEGITESAFVRHVMEMAVESAGRIPVTPPQSSECVRRCCRVSVRLRPNDGLLVWECVGKHRVSMSAYAGRIIGDHESAVPLPIAEVVEVSIDEADAIGRRLSEIGRALTRGKQGAGVSYAVWKAFVAALGRLRDRTDAVIRSNASSGTL